MHTLRVTPGSAGGEVAQNQPLTSIVDSIRATFVGTPVGADLWIALAWCLGILVVAVVAAGLVYRRRMAR